MLKADVQEFRKPLNNNLPRSRLLLLSNSLAMFYEIRKDLAVAGFTAYSIAIDDISTELWKYQAQIGTTALRNTNNSVEK